MKAPPHFLGAGVGKKKKKPAQKKMADLISDMRKNKELIHVLVPTMGDVIGIGASSFLQSLDRLSMTPDCPFKFEWSMCHGKTPVEYARNYLLKHFLNGRASRAWFLDTDMLPPENALDLLFVDADIAAPVAFAFNHATKKQTAGLKLCAFLYNLTKNYAYNPIVPADPNQRIVDVDGVGTAGMVIKRHVLEDRRMWLNDEYVGLDGKQKKISDELGTDSWVPPIFRTPRKPNGEILRGEDLDFCYRAKAAGYSIKVDLAVKYGHVKNINTLEVANFASEIATRAAKGIKVAPNVGAEINANQVEGQGRLPKDAGLCRMGQGPGGQIFYRPGLRGGGQGNGAAAFGASPGYGGAGKEQSIHNPQEKAGETA